MLLMFYLKPGSYPIRNFLLYLVNKCVLAVAKVMSIGTQAKALRLGVGDYKNI